VQSAGIVLREHWAVNVKYCVFKLTQLNAGFAAENQDVEFRVLVGEEMPLHSSCTTNLQNVDGLRRFFMAFMPRRLLAELSQA